MPAFYNDQRHPFLPREAGNLSYIRTVSYTHLVSKLWVTASGGPFRGKTIADLEAVTPVQALAHPTWNMGADVYKRQGNAGPVARRGARVVRHAGEHALDDDVRLRGGMHHGKRIGRW